MTLRYVVPTPKGGYRTSSLGFEMRVPDPEGEVPGVSLGFDLSVPDPEGRVLCCTLEGSEGDPHRGLLLGVDATYLAG